MAEMNDYPDRYDRFVLAALNDVLAITEPQVIRRVSVSALVDGLTLAEDIATTTGTLVVGRGQEINRAMRLRLKNFSANVGVQPSVRVFVPLEMAEQFAEQESRAVGQRMRNMDMELLS